MMFTPHAPGSCVYWLSVGLLAAAVLGSSAPEAGRGAGCWLLTNHTAAEAAERPTAATKNGRGDDLRFCSGSKLCGCGVRDLDEMELEVGGSEGLAGKRPLEEKCGCERSGPAG